MDRRKKTKGKATIGDKVVKTKTVEIPNYRGTGETKVITKVKERPRRLLDVISPESLFGIGRKKKKEITYRPDTPLAESPEATPSNEVGSAERRFAATRMKQEQMRLQNERMKESVKKESSSNAQNERMKEQAVNNK